MTYGIMVFAFSMSIYTVIRQSRISEGHTTATDNKTILCTLNGTECYRECTEDNKEGSFKTYASAIKTVLWMLYDPGDFEVVECSEGLSRSVAQVIWFLYNLVASVTLMTLLIALMSASIRYILHLGQMSD